MRRKVYGESARIYCTRSRTCSSVKVSAQPCISPPPFLIMEKSSWSVLACVICEVKLAGSCSRKGRRAPLPSRCGPVSYTHLRAHETDSYLVCRLLLEK